MKPLVGLIPAGGRAARVAPLPCSKEIYPVGYQASAGGARGRRPTAACDCVLEAVRRAGAERAFIVLGDGKWDIPAYLRDGRDVGLHLAYLTVQQSPSVPHTVDQATVFLHGQQVLFGFPDILFQPRDAFQRLLAHQDRTGSTVTLGLFPAVQASSADMVDCDTEGRVTAIVVKPASTRLRHAWIIAVWRPDFTAFLHDELGRRAAGSAPAEGRPAAELFMGDVFRSAIAAGMPIDSVAFPEGSFLDIGTPHGLARLWDRGEGPLPFGST